MLIRTPPDIDFLGANRQFDWLELSLVYDKSDKHNAAYDSYDVEMASKICQAYKFH